MRLLIKQRVFSWTDTYDVTHMMYMMKMKIESIL